MGTHSEVQDGLLFFLLASGFGHAGNGKMSCRVSRVVFLINLHGGVGGTGDLAGCGEHIEEIK